MREGHGLPIPHSAKSWLFTQYALRVSPSRITHHASRITHHAIHTGGAPHMPKTKVAILGATGAVGQRFVQLLDGHPWFEVTAVTGSDRTVGQPYGAGSRWR